MDAPAPPLPYDIFLQVVRNTPLISIDLLILNGNDEVLVGWRNNLPARDCWFVPGGRIYKDETIRDAFTRITRNETGMSLNTEQAEFHGVYEHLHPYENFAGEPGFGTHYIVLAFKLKPKLSGESVSLPLEQHKLYQWMSVSELLAHKQVHPYVKNYFYKTETF